MTTRGQACVLLRESDAYAPDAFRSGAAKLGYAVTSHAHAPTDRDLLIVWNRRRTDEHVIRSFEKAGAKILVAENGYIGKDREGGKLFALARDHHAGCGTWPVGSSSRWHGLGVEVKPWRHDGETVVVFGQRCIGEDGVASPEGWTERTVAALEKTTKRPIRVRHHPGVARTDPYDSLRNAWAAVTWASGAAIKALVAGYPVFHGLPGWIGGPAASPHLDDIENPWMGDRLPMLERLAWAQWSRAEIASGEALAWLVQ